MQSRHLVTNGRSTSEVADSRSSSENAVALVCMSSICREEQVYCELAQASGVGNEEIHQALVAGTHRAKVDTPCVKASVTQVQHSPRENSWPSGKKEEHALLLSTRDSAVATVSDLVSAHGTGSCCAKNVGEASATAIAAIAAIAAVATPPQRQQVVRQGTDGNVQKSTEARDDCDSTGLALKMEDGTLAMESITPRQPIQQCDQDNSYQALEWRKKSSCICDQFDQQYPPLGQVQDQISQLTPFMLDDRRRVPLLLQSPQQNCTAGRAPPAANKLTAPVTLATLPNKCLQTFTNAKSASDMCFNGKASMPSLMMGVGSARPAAREVPSTLCEGCQSLSPSKAVCNPTARSQEKVVSHSSQESFTESAKSCDSVLLPCYGKKQQQRQQLSNCDKHLQLIEDIDVRMRRVHALQEESKSILCSISDMAADVADGLDRVAVSDEEAYDVLKLMHCKLVEKFSWKSVKDTLFSNGILNEEDKALVESIRIDRDARNFLLDVVRAQGKRGLEVFANALRETHQKDLYHFVTNTIQTYKQQRKTSMLSTLLLGESPIDCGGAQNLGATKCTTCACALSLVSTVMCQQSTLDAERFTVSRSEPYLQPRTMHQALREGECASCGGRHAVRTAGEYLPTFSPSINDPDRFTCGRGGRSIAAPLQQHRTHSVSAGALTPGSTRPMVMGAGTAPRQRSRSRIPVRTLKKKP